MDTLLAVSELHLDGDVRVVSGQDHVLALLPPLDQSHRKCKDLAEEDQTAARPVHLTVRGNLDDGS